MRNTTTQVMRANRIDTNIQTPNCHFSLFAQQTCHFAEQFSTSESEVFPTWAPLPTPKEMKASLLKVQAFKFILQNAASKLRFSKLQSSNSIF